MYPLVTDLVCDGIPVAVTCRVLKLSRQGYYKWLKNPVTNRDWDDAIRINAALNIHKQQPTLGYRFICDQINDLGHKTCESSMLRLCQTQNISSVIVRKTRKKARKTLPATHLDLVKRNFVASCPNQIWLTDITEHKTKETKLYLCAIKDVFSNKIVGYSIAKHMQATLAVSALKNAIKSRKPAGTIVHSDRGSQFQSKQFKSLLVQHGLLGSMGKVGAAGDNSAMESFFSLLQKNVLNQQNWVSYESLRIAVVGWVHTTYHLQRKQRKLGKRTPVQFELDYKNKQLAVVN